MLDELIKDGQKEVQMIVFKLGQEEYSVPIKTIQEIIMPQQYTRIPSSPTFVEGVINLRGHIIPIINGRKKFNMKTEESEAAEKNRRIMVVEVDKEAVGLIVDSVTEVIYLDVENIEPPPIELEDDSDFLWGVGKHEDRLLILLNPDKLLSLNNQTIFSDFASISDNIKQAV